MKQTGHTVIDMTLLADDSALERGQLHAEIVRLVSLLQTHGIEWRLPSVPVVVPIAEAKPSGLSTVEKSSCFVAYFEAAPTPIPSAGKAKQPASLATHRPVAMSGWQAFAKSRASNAGSAITVC
jgi:hypothetical protein